MNLLIGLNFSPTLIKVNLIPALLYIHVQQIGVGSKHFVDCFVSFLVHV